MRNNTRKSVWLHQHVCKSQLFACICCLQTKNYMSAMWLRLPRVKNWLVAASRSHDDGDAGKPVWLLVAYARTSRSLHLRKFLPCLISITNEGTALKFNALYLWKLLRYLRVIPHRKTFELAKEVAFQKYNMTRLKKALSKSTPFYASTQRFISTGCNINFAKTLRVRFLAWK